MMPLTGRRRAARDGYQAAPPLDAPVERLVRRQSVAPNLHELAGQHNTESSPDHRFRPLSLLRFALKLRFDSGFVYDRPYILDPFVFKLVEDVFGKRDSLPVYREAKQEPFRRAVEA